MAALFQFLKRLCFCFSSKEFKYVKAIASHSVTALFKLILPWTDLIGFYFMTASTFTGGTFNATGLAIHILQQYLS